ncbi:MAG: transcriptional/translational regulatory protein YebC/TACO1, partial [Flavobacteriales bacterium]
EISNETIQEIDAEELELELIEGGAQEVEKEEEYISIYTSFEDFGTMQSKLAELGIEAKSTEIQQIPKTTTTLSIDQAMDVLKIVDKFEEDDDIQAVYHNMQLTDELIAQLETE